jgi:hypothetical protein
MAEDYPNDHLEELRECSLDPIYFINTYLFTTHPKWGEVKLTLFEHQEDLIYFWNKTRCTITKSPRRTGRTEAACAFFFWYTLFNHNSTILMVAPNTNISREIQYNIRFYYERLPSWMKENFTIHSEGTRGIRFDNGSVLRITTYDDTNSLRGIRISALYCDELGTIDTQKSQHFFLYTQGILDRLNKCVIVSVPSIDSSNAFQQIFSSDNEFKRLSIGTKK